MSRAFELRVFLLALLLCRFPNCYLLWPTKYPRHLMIFLSYLLCFFGFWFPVFSSPWVYSTLFDWFCFRSLISARGSSFRSVCFVFCNFLCFNFLMLFFQFHIFFSLFFAFFNFHFSISCNSIVSGACCLECADMYVCLSRVASKQLLEYF